MLRDLRKLRDQGNALRPPATDSLGDGLFELRTGFDGNIFRHIFMFYDDRQIIILESFVKKQQKTPQKHIEIAKERRSLVYSGGIPLGHVAVH